MKILISGSRAITEFDLSAYIPGETDLIISGGANGIDRLAEQYADKNKISKLVLRPDYRRFGKAAPIIRNKQMVDIADGVVVIWDGKSSGSKNTADYAKKQGKLLTLVNLNT